MRLVRQLQRELGTLTTGTLKRVTDQLGYGVESVRCWVRQADIDVGEKPSTTSGDKARIKALEQENKELRRANEILKKKKHRLLCRVCGYVEPCSIRTCLG